MARDKAEITVTIRPPQCLVSRSAEAFCSTPSDCLRGWTTTSCYLDQKSGSVFLEPEWEPASYPYAKADYQVYPTDAALWIESSGALGRGDTGIGFAGSATVVPGTSWFTHLSTSHLIGRNRGVVISFLWFRPANDTTCQLKIYPRMDVSKAIAGTIPTAFAPFYFVIDAQNRLSVMEYGHDNYDAFITNPVTSYVKTYTHPLVVNAQALASDWHSIQVQSISDDDVLVTSDILAGGGFLYRSAMDRQNIWMLPEGVPAIGSSVGGASQVQLTPLDCASTGSLKSSTYSKKASNSVYPTVKVFGWSPVLINTDRGFMSGQLIAADATGTAGIKFNIYSVTKDVAGFETETLVDPTGGAKFKDFKVELVLTATGNVSPVINDVIVDYENDTATVADPVLDVSADVRKISLQAQDDGCIRGGLAIRNQDGQYNALAERVMNEVDIDVGGEDLAVLYTENPSYDWFTTPTQAALELQWEAVDGFGYLNREMCANHPAYDGGLLSDMLTEFMSRMGYPAEKLDIDATPDVYLPKKRGDEPYQFKPEDGCAAADFIRKLKEWFGPTYTCRFSRDDIFQFKAIASDAGGLETPTIHRTYYMDSASKPTPDDHVIYGDAKSELVMDQFYNEIWVVGEDRRANRPLISVYQNVASQSDKNAPDYAGRRLIMIVITKLNRQSALDAVCDRLALFYGSWDVRLTFNTRVDATLQVDDFFKVDGVAAVWRVRCLDYEIDERSMASSTINSTTPVIKGMKVTAVQWPVYW